MSRRRWTSRKAWPCCRPRKGPPTVPPDRVEERIAIESDSDVVTARQRARELAAELELTSTDQTLLATAISEVARNITTYATRGEVLVSIVHDEDRRGIQV